MRVIDSDVEPERLEQDVLVLDEILRLIVVGLGSEKYITVSF